MEVKLRSKIVDPEDLENLSLELKAQGHKVVTVNGSFDLLHAGHLHILNEAALQGDKLIVLLNSDLSIKKYKSEDRPIIALKYRLEMMAALECVDFVSNFDETDPINCLARVKPDVHVNGIEYKDGCIEEQVVKKFGGKLHFVDRIDGLATSQIIKKIQKL